MSKNSDAMSLAALRVESWARVGGGLREAGVAFSLQRHNTARHAALGEKRTEAWRGAARGAEERAATHGQTRRGDGHRDKGWEMGSENRASPRCSSSFLEGVLEETGEGPGEALRAERREARRRMGAVPQSSCGPVITPSHAHDAHAVHL